MKSIRSFNNYFQIFYKIYTKIFSSSPRTALILIYVSLVFQHSIIFSDLIYSY